MEFNGHESIYLEIMMHTDITKGHAPPVVKVTTTTHVHGMHITLTTTEAMVLIKAMFKV